MASHDITTAAGFNRAVVHYDARPPTCQDWGPIFVADNMVVTRCTTCGPACDPDVNCDGVPDQGDVACIILAVAGDLACFCQADPDFNHDGVPDQGDVADLILVVAGAACP